MAIASPRIRTDIVEVSEFPDVVARYAVQGVPKTILNDRSFFEGALPEPDVLAAVIDAAGGTPEQEAT
jgi:alkyl hydroperoxide reductase subunit AhpF